MENSSLLPVPQNISSFLWKTNASDNECFDIPGLNVKITKNVKLSFDKIEHFVDDFVETFVPNKLDDLYRISSKIKAAQKLGNKEELNCTYSEADETVQLISRKVVDVEKVRLLILEDDLDDFDLRVHPAKLKVREAVVDFMTNSNKSKNIAEMHSVELHSRLPNARDLMSFMQSDGEQHDELQAQAVCSSQNQQEDAFEQEMEIVHLNNDGLDTEAVERLNQDLMELHALMNDMNTMIHQQADTVDTIADHIEDAAGNVEVGKQQLKKASYLKVAMFPIMGAVIGGVVGGPIGFVAGMKVGSVTGGVAMAGVTGGVLGYQGGKIMKKKHGKEEIPMKELDHQSTMDR